MKKRIVKKKRAISKEFLALVARSERQHKSGLNDR